MKNSPAVNKEFDDLSKKTNILKHQEEDSNERDKKILEIESKIALKPVTKNREKFEIEITKLKDKKQERRISCCLQHQGKRFLGRKGRARSSSN